MLWNQAYVLYKQVELDQVIVGSVDLASDLRAVKGHVENHEQSNIADGATAFILKRHEDAIRDGDKVYSIIKGFGAASAGGCDEKKADISAQVESIQNACLDAQCHLDEIDQLIFSTQEEVLTVVRF